MAANDHARWYEKIYVDCNDPANILDEHRVASGAARVGPFKTVVEAANWRDAFDPTGEIVKTRSEHDDLPLVIEAGEWRRESRAES